MVNLLLSLLLAVVYGVSANGPISCPLTNAVPYNSSADAPTCTGHMCADECYGNSCVRKCIRYIPGRTEDEFATALGSAADGFVCTGGTDDHSSWSICACFTSYCLPNDRFVKVDWNQTYAYNCSAGRSKPYGWCRGDKCTTNGKEGARGCEVGELDVTVLVKTENLEYPLFPGFNGCLYNEYPGDPVKCACDGNDCNTADQNATVVDTKFVNCTSTDGTTCTGHYCHIWQDTDHGLTVTKQDCITITGTNRLPNQCTEQEYLTTGHQTECLCSADCCNVDLKTAKACANDPSCGQQAPTTTAPETTTSGVIHIVQEAVLAISLSIIALTCYSQFACLIE